MKRDFEMHQLKYDETIKKKRRRRKKEISLSDDEEEEEEEETSDKDNPNEDNPDFAG